MIQDSIRNLLQITAEMTSALEQGQLIEIEKLFSEIHRPMSIDDVTALVSLLPDDGDTCYGLNWTILHMVEAAPDWPVWGSLRNTSNWWIEMLLGRLANAGLHPPARTR